MQPPLQMNRSPSHKCQDNLGDAIVSMIKINHSNGAFDSVIGAIVRWMVQSTPKVAQLDSAFHGN